MRTPESIGHLRIATVLVLSVIVLGTAGYMLIEQLPFNEQFDIGRKATPGL